MAHHSAAATAQTSRRMSTRPKIAQKHQGVSKATRRSERIQNKDKLSRTNTEHGLRESKEQEHFPNLRQAQRQVTETLKRDRNHTTLPTLEQPRKRLRIQGTLHATPHKQGEKRIRPREDDASVSLAPLETSAKRAGTCSVSPEELIDRERIEIWRERGTWPTEEEEGIMDRFRAHLQRVAPKKRSTSSLRRKRSDASIGAETAQTRTPSDEQPREQKSAPYKHPRYEVQLQERGSFMDDHEEGITTQSKALLMKLLKTHREPPDDTLFSDDILFKKTCKSLRGENETKVILRIADLIFPSAEVLAVRGAKHLDILRETTNAGWNNAIPFHGPRPQPDFGLGFKREAFTREQLYNLQPLIERSYVEATYNMYFPFFTSEVKCGASALDVADRQNLHSQSVSLRKLVELFGSVDRLDELSREINGFSISHSDEYVRIWGHYVVLQEQNITFHRHSIAKFDISPTAEGDQRWKAWTFVMNVYEFWVPDHFQRLCSAIDMLPAERMYEILSIRRPDLELASSRSGLSQQLENYGLADEAMVADNESNNQPITPDTTMTGSSQSKRKKAK